MEQYVSSGLYEYNNQLISTNRGPVCSEVIGYEQGMVINLEKSCLSV